MLSSEGEATYMCLRQFYNAFSGYFSHTVLSLLRERDDIEYIRPDAVAELASVGSPQIMASHTQYVAAVFRIDTR